jgi:hypothetical protein
MPDNLDLVLEALRRSNRELDSAIIDESTLDQVSIEEACQAMHVQTEPKDVELRESKKPSGWLGLADSICHDPYRRKP